MSPLFTTGERDPVTPGAEDSPYPEADSPASCPRPGVLLPRCIHLKHRGVKMHPSERARAFRETVSTVEVDDVLYGQPVRRLAPTIPPGSIQESEALAEIDRARHAEVNPPSRRTQRRRARQHWRDRDRHVS